MHLASRSAIALPLTLLVLLAMMTFWIDKTVQPAALKLDGSSRHDPDYMIYNFATTQTDIQGDLRYKLAAAEMRHFPDDDTTELQRPRYTQFAVGKPYTQIYGQRGYVSSNGEEVTVVDQVRVTRQAFGGKGEMTVDTDRIVIRPNDEYASTESPVVIRQEPKTVVYATGMIYEKKKRTVTLLHKVRAHYERPVPVGTGAVNKQAHLNQKKAKTPNKTDQAKAGAAKTGVAKNAPKQPSKSNNERVRRRYE